MTGALDGNAVIITGAGSGLGEAYAVHAAALGAAVLVNDIDETSAARTVAQIIAAGGQAVACPGDISRWEFAAELVEACCAAFDTVTGLVNNAGLLRPARMVNVGEDDFRTIVDVNLLGTAACAQAAARYMLKTERGGSIVNVTSGSHAGDVGLGAYAATKGAIASLTYSWAMELRGTKVRMNAVAPRGTTGMTVQNAGQRSEQIRNRPSPSSPIPPAEVNAPVVSYLLSERSRNINGQLVRISGQQLALISHPTIAQPVLSGDWTFEAVAAAFDDTLEAQQHALGISTQQC